jgi:hypothetical protein
VSEYRTTMTPAMKEFLMNDFLNPKKKKQPNRWHIEYIVHVYVDADSREEALEKGAYHLHMLEMSGNLSDHCELLADEIEDDSTPDCWEPDEDGNIMCLDCMNPYTPSEIVTDPRWNDPRCEECHHKSK